MVTMVCKASTKKVVSFSLGILAPRESLHWLGTYFQGLLYNFLVFKTPLTRNKGTPPAKPFTNCGKLLLTLLPRVFGREPETFVRHPEARFDQEMTTS